MKSKIPDQDLVQSDSHQQNDPRGRHPTTDLSLRKLLSSHSSIYNVLANPELDINIPTSPPLGRLERGSPSPLNYLADPSASISSWQSLHLSAGRLIPSSPSDLLRSESTRPSTSSVLSNASDEEESMVVVPSDVMLFETDEESCDDETRDQLGDDISGGPRKNDVNGDDESTLVSRPEGSLKHVGLRLNTSSSFIMPRLSLSENDDHFKLIILTSSDEVMKYGAMAMMSVLRDTLPAGLLQLRVSHVSLSTKPLDLDLAAISSSQLIILINDGSQLFAEFLASASALGSLDDLPRLTLVNVLTKNYFINLLDIIDSWKPDQIWKTSSLTNDNFTGKLKSFVEEELSQTGNRYEKEFAARKGKFESKDRSFDNSHATSSSVHSTMTLSKRPDYRDLERRLRSELLASNAFNDTDPLRLTSNLRCLSRVMELLLGLFGPYKKMNHENGTSDLSLHSSSYSSFIGSLEFWLICSFSMGLGIGITFASGAVGFFIVSVRDYFKCLLSSSLDSTNELWVDVKRGNDFMLPSKTFGVDKLKFAALEFHTGFVSGANAMVEHTAAAIKSMVGNDFVMAVSTYTEVFKSFSAMVMNAALDGFEKATGAVLNCLRVSI